MECHLENHHQLTEDGSVKQPKKLKQLAFTQFHSSVTTQTDLLDALVDWIVDAAIPFAAVERDSFKDVLDVHKRTPMNTKLPSSDTVRRRIKKKQEEKQTEVAKKLQESNARLHLTLDCWTSPFNVSFLAIAVNYINAKDSAWTRNRVLVGFENMGGGHSADDMFQIVRKVCETYQITKQIGCVVGDNARSNTKLASMVKAWTEENKSEFHAFEHVRCIAHVVNLAAQAALSVTCKPVRKIRAYAKFIKGSPKRAAEYERAKTFKNVQGNKLKLDCKTRWNSTWQMVSDARQQKLALDVLRRDHSLFSPESDEEFENGEDEEDEFALSNGLPLVSDDDWKCLDEMAELLKYFAMSTDIVSQEDVFLSAAFVQFEGLMRCVEQMSTGSDVPIVKLAATRALEKLSVYYAMLDQPVYYLALLLDPRFKPDALKLLNWHDQYIEMGEAAVRRAILKEEMYPHVQSPPSVGMHDFPNATRNECGTLQDGDGMQDSYVEFDQMRILNQRLMEQRSQHACQGEMGSIELRNYFAEPTSFTYEDPLEYWTKTQCRFPVLARLAKNYLSIPCSSVDIEREFSLGRWTQPYIRGCMHPDTLRELMLYRSWMASE